MSNQKNEKKNNICRFFNLPAGCKKGDECDFQHIKTTKKGKQKQSENFSKKRNKKFRPQNRRRRESFSIVTGFRIPNIILRDLEKESSISKTFQKFSKEHEKVLESEKKKSMADKKAENEFAKNNPDFMRSYEFEHTWEAGKNGENGKVVKKKRSTRQIMDIFERQRKTVKNIKYENDRPNYFGMVKLISNDKMTVERRREIGAKRLMRDLKEIHLNPIPTVTARPLEKNIFEWHCNLVGPPGSLYAGCVFHVVLIFPSTYPLRAPTGRLMTHIPHHAVFETSKGYSALCLDILEAHHFGEQRGFGWTTAYSVQSVLLQLSSFLFDQEQKGPNNDHVRQVKGRARNYQCKKCGHDMKNLKPFPWKKGMFRFNKRRLKEPPKRFVKLGRTDPAIRGPETGYVKNDDAETLTINKIFSKKVGKKSFLQMAEKRKVKKRIFQKKVVEKPVDPGTTEEIIEIVDPRALKRKKEKMREKKIAEMKKEEKEEIEEESDDEKELTESEKKIRDSKNRNSKNRLLSLPSEILKYEIFTFIPKLELLKIGHTCSYLFQLIFSIFSLERESLICFHSKIRFNDSHPDTKRKVILGFGITCRKNPYSNEIAYVDVPSLDYLSYRSFLEEGVRMSVNKKKFTEFLPLWINPQHAQTSFTFFKFKISAIYETNFFNPINACDLLMKIMNTCIVRVMSGHAHASEKALIGYFQCFRLVLSLIKKHPWIVKLIDGRIKRFLDQRDSFFRDKKREVSIGNFFQLLPFSTFPFSRVICTLLDEQWDRNAMWILKKYPALAFEIEKKRRILCSFEASLISMQLVMFNYEFYLLMNPKNAMVEKRGRISRMDSVLKDFEEIGKRLDSVYGQPPAYVQRNFQKKIFEIQKIDSFEKFFNKINVKPVKPIEVLLKDCILNSFRRKYHSMNMIFSNRGRKTTNSSSNSKDSWSPWSSNNVNENKNYKKLVSEINKLKPIKIPRNQSESGMKLLNPSYGTKNREKKFILKGEKYTYVPHEKKSVKTVKTATTVTTVKKSVPDVPEKVQKEVKEVKEKGKKKLKDSAKARKRRKRRKNKRKREINERREKSNKKK